MSHQQNKIRQLPEPGIKGLHLAIHSPVNGDERFELPRPADCKGQIWVVRSAGTSNLLICVQGQSGTIAAIPAPGGSRLLVSVGDGWLVFRGELC